MIVMGSISSASPANPWVNDLLQTLSNTGNPALSSPTVQSAIENAAPVDLVQLSAAAQQLQLTGALFGTSDVPEATADPNTLLLEALNSSLPGSAVTSTTASTTATGGTAGAASLVT
jgi:hypothetical protein